RCTLNRDTGGGRTPEGMKKVKGIIHWVDAASAVDVDVHLFDHLFKEPTPLSEGRTLEDDLNPDSLRIVECAKAEPALAASAPGERFQFERTGYFVRAEADGDRPTFFRSVTLRDSWAKIEKKTDGGGKK
ncbi:MAG: glutamine--tRNA ligase, partial [Planctomycetota bacterium]